MRVYAKMVLTQNMPVRHNPSAGTVPEEVHRVTTTEISAAVEREAPASKTPKVAYYTVVYRVRDEAAFKADWNRIHDLMRLEGEQPFDVTAISSDHEMRRVALIEDALSEDPDPYDFMEEVEEILNTADVIGLWASKKGAHS
jgi:hypothetical protein